MDKGQSNSVSREPWVAPEISVLDIEETHFYKSGRGRDHKFADVDCQKS